MRLTYVRMGTLSGIATSLRDTLAEQVELIDVDVLPYARRVGLVPFRLGAVASSYLQSPRPLWTRTALWAKGIQAALTRDGHLTPPGRVLFIGTRFACTLDPGLRYWVYTDRVAYEGARGDARFTSPSSPGWMEREQRFLRGAKRVYLTAPSSAPYLTGNYGVAPASVDVVAAGPNTDLGPPEYRDTCRRILFVGIEWDRKGGPDLVSAFAQVRRSGHENVELEIVGCDPQGDFGRGVVRSGRIPHAEMGPVFSRADLLVLPSYHEASPIVLIEALLKGIPVVATTVGNIPWIVGDGGLCVEPGRPDLLADAITLVIESHPDFRKRAIRRGEVMAPIFNWKTIAERMAADIVAADD